MIILPKRLRSELSDNASTLLMKILDEPKSRRLTETEKDFFDVVLSLSEISPAYKYLADSFVGLYHFIQEEKISNPEFIEELKAKYPINWELFS